ncbi:competence protein CoiA family protein [Aeromonas sp. 601115]|uniref:competence protein CoiA family protein n=1 Tax=Aeromonas sp. 601115 TaxID=2712038 RepID=UPI003BA0C263
MTRPTLHLLPYGMLDGNLTHVSQVPSGLACGCLCPGCGASLVAKKGKKKLHHFAHAKDADCGSGVETALHLAAKEILEIRRVIFLPAVEVKVPGRSYSRVLDILAPEKEYSLEQVVLERRIDSIVPDVIAHIRGRAIAIEIKVSHAVDDNKATIFRGLGLSVIEIDLSKAPRTFTLEELEPLVIGPGKHKSWVFNAAALRKCEQILSGGKRRSTVYRGYALHVDGCPIPARVWRERPYANFIDDCTCCGHLLDSEEGYIVCGG